MSSEKYLRVMADYCSTGLWDKSGCNVDPEDYPLSEATKKLLDEWQQLYEENDDWKEPEQRKTPPFDIPSFAKQGLEVAKAVKRDLPDYTIVYFDEEKSNQTDGHEDRKIFEYEING